MAEKSGRYGGSDIRLRRNLDMNEKLQLQQYLTYHPIMSKEKKYRVAYVSLVKYLCKDNAEDFQWSESMLMLMKEKIMGKEDFFSVSIKNNNSLYYDGKKNAVLKNKFQKYRYNILTDCLFINAFNDKTKGKKILSKICDFYPNNKKKLIKLFENFYRVNLKDIEKFFPRMIDIYKIINLNRNFIREKEKKIMITANMSAGKSTLLNALAGKKVNKTQNDTCTAKIHYLLNKAGEDGFSYELDHDLELNASTEILMDDNEKNHSLEIFVGTRFRSLYEINQRICFIDTPGVNSSQNEEHRKLTDKVISDNNCELLIFLLNGENIGTDDDKRHLEYVHNEYHGPIVFLVNKLDGFKKDIDSISSTLKKVENDLVRIGFNNPKVYPISAYAGFLAKMTMYGEKLTEDEIDDMNFRKRKLSKEEFRYDKYYSIKSQDIDEKNENQVLLRNSGILALEKIIYK